MSLNQFSRIIPPAHSRYHFDVKSAFPSSIPQGIGSILDYMFGDRNNRGFVSMPNDFGELFTHYFGSPRGGSGSP